MKGPNKDVPLETVFKNLLNDYKKVCKWNNKLVEYAKQLEKEVAKLRETETGRRIMRRDYDSLKNRLKNYHKWKNGYKSMCVILKRHNIPFKLERELLTESDIESEINSLLRNDTV